MVVAASALTALTFLGLATPAVILVFTFLLGCGAAVIWPAWQSIQPELVPREQIPQAASLAAVNMNIARAVGPALGGILVAAAGAGWVFALNAAAFLVVALAVASWNREARPDPVGRERMIAGLRSGARYVRNTRIMRRVLVQSLLFVPIGTAVWALLPFVASKQLDSGAGGYGLLLGALGLGAVGGAMMLPAIRRRVSVGGLITGSFILYAIATAALAVTPSLALALLVLAFGGAAWLGLLSTLNATIQLVLPEWVRARGLSYYLAAVSGGQALGGIVWGALASQLDVRTTLLIAAGALLLATVASRRLPLPNLSRVQPGPTIRQPPPEIDDVLDPEAGPVLVTIDYVVRSGEDDAFIDAMAVVARVRRRTGARRWDLYRDPAAPNHFFETFSVATWGEHRRQHLGRITVLDRELIEDALAHLARPPVVRHLVVADAPIKRSQPSEPESTPSAAVENDDTAPNP
jgi:MFS family permease